MGVTGTQHSARHPARRTGHGALGTGHARKYEGRSRPLSSRAAGPQGVGGVGDLSARSPGSAPGQPRGKPQAPGGKPQVPRVKSQTIRRPRGRPQAARRQIVGKPQADRRQIAGAPRQTTSSPMRSTGHVTPLSTVTGRNPAPSVASRSHCRER